MNILTLIAHSAQQLQSELGDIDVCTQYAWWLMQALLKKTKAELLAQHEIVLTEKESAQLKEWIAAITQQHKPLGYIMQEVPFGDLMLAVRPPILIPRMETEEWVLSLVHKLHQAGIQKFNLLDMCTGSGCIGLLIAASFSQARVYAVDIHPQAILLAEENKARLGLTHMQIISSDLFQALSSDSSFDIIVSNPPYITHEEYEQLDPSVRLWEDKGALVADNAGHAVIETIIAQAPRYLRYNAALAQANIPQLWLEIGHLQGPSVEHCMQDAGYVNVHTMQDAAGKDRVVVGSPVYDEHEKS